MPEPDETLPSLPEVAEEPALELDATALTDLPPIAARKITDTLPARTYEGAGTLTLTREQEELLDEPVPDDEIDIRPDGLVYVSHEYVRRLLNKVLGRLQWALIPGSPLVADGDDLYQRWILVYHGTYIAEALASRKFYPNGNMSRDDVAEAIKSDALRRCCKDPGIGLDAWNRRRGEQWRRKYAVKKLCTTPKGNQYLWRRIDADPLNGEIPNQAPVEPAEVEGNKGRAEKLPGSEPAAVKTVASPPPSTSPKTDPRTAADVTPPRQNPKPGPLRPVPRQPARAAVIPPTAAPKITDGQVRLLWVRATGAGLVDKEDADQWIDYMATNLLIDVPDRRGKKSKEVAVAMMRQIEGGAYFQKLVKALEVQAQANQVEI